MSGIFGAIGKDSCHEELYYGTDYHSHLGTQFAGLAVWDGQIHRKKIHDIRASQFKTKFHDEYVQMKGAYGIGVISEKDEQPICMRSRLGSFAIVTNGFIENDKELAHELFKEGKSFSEVSDGSINQTELAAKLIIQGTSLIQGIEYMFSKIRGSCSLLLLNNEGIYAARDKQGCSPLVVGQRDDGSLAVTTETSAFGNLGYKIIKYLESGEIVLMDKNGLRSKSSGSKCNQICSFLWIYTGFPASSYEGINVETVRERCGRCLAKDDTVKADMAAGIPDSGTTHAIGYAMGAKIPLRRPLVKYTPGFDRSYIPASQERRDLVARMKLLPIPEIIKGKEIVFCDDSIVRGTQLKNYTIKKLWDCGAKGIHLRIACPPLMFPCKFNYSTRTREELIARRAIKAVDGKAVENVDAYLDEKSPQYKKMVEWINKDIGSTTLRYQKLQDMIEAIGVPKEKLCVYCWSGKSGQD